MKINNTSKISRYARQITLPEIGAEGQKKIRQSRMALVGCGALGSVSAEMLVRMGVGRIKLIDRDIVDITNLSRQSLFDEDDVIKATPKATAAAQKLELINSDVEISSHVHDVDWRNISNLLSDCDLVVDGTDNFETRFLMNEFSLKYNIPWVYGGALAARGMAAFFCPKKTPCFDCLLNVLPAPEETETCDTAGVMAPIIHWVSALQVTLALRYFIEGAEGVKPLLYTMDIWRGRVDSFPMFDLKALESCPTCEKGEYKFLEGKTGFRSHKLCGRNAVQLTFREKTEIDLHGLSKRLAGAGQVTEHPAMLKFKTEKNEIIVFRDGRAIVQGTTDVEQARSIFAKYMRGRIV